MKQQIDNSLWEEFQEEQKQTLKKLEQRAKVSNSGIEPKGKWIKQIVDKVRISELASGRGITSCPEGHTLYFDDSQGFFCCAYTHFGVRDCFSGNLVDFTEWLMEQGQW